MERITIGVLALQGGFAAHLDSLHRLQVPSVTLEAIAVRTPEELELCDALIIPGGESTTIALLAKLSGLLEPLRAFVQTKAVWGTCAGAILMSREVVGGKKGGQELLGGVDVRIGRNGWGSQVESFEADMLVDGMTDPYTPFKGVFIRAPIVLALLPPNPSATTNQSPIQVIARLPESINPSSTRSPFPLPATQDIAQGFLPTPPNEPDAMYPPEDLRHIVALRQGRHLVTTFHPELTEDNRFHELFVRECALGRPT